MTYQDIQQKLAGVVDFEVAVGRQSATVRKDTPSSWLVYLDEDLIGSFAEYQEGRATYYKSEVAGEPGVTNWVGDDIVVLISRMITIADS